MERKVSRKRTIITLVGVRAIKEEYFVCPRCKDEQTGNRIIHHSECLRDILPSNSKYGYDVEIEVGYLQYVENKQMNEMEVIFKEEYGISIPQSQIHELGIRFLKHMVVVHYLAAPQLRKLFEFGCVYHIDATCEAGRGMELTIIEGCSGIVLGAWKIPTENEEIIKRYLRPTVEAFGNPIAFVSDMGNGMMSAIEGVMEDLNLDSRQLICHMHFVKAVGKKILEDQFKELKEQFKKQRTLTQLNNFVNKTGKIIKSQASTMRDFIKQWEKSNGQIEITNYLECITILRALAQWVLLYGKDCKGIGFPYALPHLFLFERCAEALNSLLALFEKNTFDQQAIKYVERLQHILQSPIENSQMHKTVHDLNIKYTVFSELRKVLRLEKTDLYKDEKNKKIPDKHEVVAELKEDTSNFRKTLEQRLETDIDSNAEEYALRVILRYLDEYECYLFDHFFTSYDDSGNEEIKLINRTNNILEHSYRKQKHEIRRRTGSKNLGFVFEHLFPAASMVVNLKNPIYQQTVLDNKTRGDLAPRFSALDDILDYRETPMFQDDLDLIGGRLPKADRKIVGKISFTKVISRLADDYTSSLEPQPV